MDSGVNPVPKAGFLCLLGECCLTAEAWTLSTNTQHARSPGHPDAGRLGSWYEAVVRSQAQDFSQGGGVFLSVSRLMSCRETA